MCPLCATRPQLMDGLCAKCWLRLAQVDDDTPWMRPTDAISKIHQETRSSGSGAIH